MQHHGDGAGLARETLVDHRDEQHVLLLAVMIGIAEVPDERDESRELCFVVRLTPRAQRRDPPLQGIECPFDEAMLAHQHVYGFHFRFLPLVAL